MELTTKQAQAVHYLKDKVTTEIIYGGGAGGGKSALAVLWEIEQCQKYPGSRWLLGRAKLKTLKETTLNTFFDLSSQLKLTKQYDYNGQAGIIYWKNGSEILLRDLYAYPADANFDSLGSLELTGGAVDEIPQITYKAWQILKSRIRYKLNEFDLIPKLLGCGNPAKNWTYSQFYLKHKNGTLEPHKKFIQSLATDNPHLPPSYLESLLSLDENSKQRLYYGNWEYDNDPARLIDFEKIQNVFTNSFVESSTMYLSADIARYGSDKMVICVWSGFRVVEIFSLAKCSIQEIADLIRFFCNKYKIPMSNVIADEDGVGGGVVDILKCKGFVNNSKALPVENQIVQYQNLKTQCYYKLAEMIQSDQIFIDCKDVAIQDDITKELEQIKRDKIDSDGKLCIVSKEDVKKNIGRSPDYSDALMMRMYFCFGQSFFTF